MPGMLRSLACAAWAFAGLAWSGLAAAQSTQVCSDRTSSAISTAACLWVGDTHMQISEYLAIQAWREERAGGSWLHAYGNLAVRDGSTTIMQLSSTPSGHGQGTHQFSNVGTHSLTASSSDRTSPAIEVTVTKHEPGIAGQTSTGTGPAGDFVRFNMQVNLFRPSGVLAYYVTPPGGAITEFARTTITSGFHVIQPDQRDFLFVAPYTAPGDYRFRVAYLGDALNAYAATSDVVIRHGVQQPTAISLSQSTASSNQTGPVTLTASVQGASGNPAPTGSVEFRDGGAILGLANVNASGVATLVTRKLRKRGPHSLTARYAGDGANSASTSSAVTHVVNFNAGVLAPINDALQ
jgi:hypothetical protein